MECAKNIRYSSQTEYAYGKYAYDFTSAHFHTSNITKVTIPIHKDSAGRLFIGFMAAPIKGETILVGEYRLPYIFTGEIKVDRKRGGLVYRIKKREGYDFGETLDFSNSVKGAKAYFIGRFSGKDYLEMLSKLK